MQLKLALTASRSTFVARSGDKAASVIRTASIVAMLGAIMAAPFAAPVTVTVCPSISIDRLANLCRVSVVIMPFAASASEAGVPASFSTIGPNPFASFSRGRK